MIRTDYAQAIKGRKNMATRRPVNTCSRVGKQTAKNVQENLETFTKSFSTPIPFEKE